MENKLPAFQFYPGDWRKDPGVQSLDYEARGIWHELLCIMHESSERGRLVYPNGDAIDDSGIAQILGISEANWKQTRSKLISRGVAKEDSDGVLYNRRMCREEAIREARREAGKKGGQIKQKPSKSQAKVQAKEGSSSSSSSSKKGNPPIIPPRPEDVPEQVWSDYMAVRGKKVLTVTAFNRIKSEAAKANMTLTEALTECCHRSWVGFKAEWVEDKSGKSNLDKLRNLAMGGDDGQAGSIEAGLHGSRGLPSTTGS